MGAEFCVLMGEDVKATSLIVSGTQISKPGLRSGTETESTNYQSLNVTKISISVWHKHKFSEHTRGVQRGTVQV